MDGTCGFILDQIIAWVTNGPGQGDIPWSIPYWIYGFPGIGKTSLAHSICERFDERKQFARLTCSCKACSFTYIIPSYIIRHFSWTIHALWYYSSGLIHIYIVLVYMSIPKKSVPST